MVSDESQDRLSGIGAARGRSGWMRRWLGKTHTKFWVMWEELEADTGLGCAKRSMLLTICDRWKQSSWVICFVKEWCYALQQDGEHSFGNDDEINSKHIKMQMKFNGVSHEE